MREILQAAWFSKQNWVWLLSPFAALFHVVSKVRLALYKKGVLKQTKAKVPVLIVGNIGIGGNGKTPVVVALAEFLVNCEYKVVVLSRGYGGNQTEFPYRVNSNDPASLVGDEPALIARRDLCDVVIDPKRARAVDYIQEHLACDVIICDDGMQHYALARDLEICVIDKRGLGNGYLLPMGPLRESKQRLKAVDFILENQGSLPINDLSTRCVSPWLSHYSHKAQAINLMPIAWINVQNERKLSILEFFEWVEDQPLPVTAMAGIGDPKRFFDTLVTMKIKANEQISLPDHHKFSAQDIPKNQCVLMTEKDAVKCAEFAHENCWFLEIGTNLSDDLLHTVKQLIDLKPKSNQSQ